MPTLGTPDDAACGWVYVLSHPQMTALKVGFTLRSVKERLDELSVTAVPGAFVWEYGVLVTNPDQVERQTHRLLADHRVASNREFFSCPLPVAIAALLTVTEYRPPLKVHDRNQIEQHAASVRKQRVLLDAWVKSAEDDVSAKVKAISVEIESLKPHFAWFWAGHTFLAALLFEQLFSAKNEVGLWIISSIVGAVSGLFHQDHIHSKRKSASSLHTRLKELELEREAINQHSTRQLQRIENGKLFESPELAVSSAPKPMRVFSTEPAPVIAPPSGTRNSATLTLEDRIAAAETRVVRPIPTAPVRYLDCNGCGRAVKLNAKVICNELRCPAKLLADA